MNDFVGILLLLGLVGCVLAIPVGIYMSFKQAEREWEENKKADEEWLAAEMKKPKASIEFITLDEVVHSTGPHEPYLTNPGSNWGYRSDSKSFADRCLAGAYERGYFMDEQRNSYPTCNIKTAKVVVK